MLGVKMRKRIEQDKVQVLNGQVDIVTSKVSCKRASDGNKRIPYIEEPQNVVGRLGRNPWDYRKEGDALGLQEEHKKQHQCHEIWSISVRRINSWRAEEPISS